jgi:hypothetical protein
MPRPAARRNREDMNMPKLLLLCALLSIAASVLLLQQRSSAVQADSFPSVISLPNGWLPEGVATGRGPVIYAGSRRHGAVYEADLRTGAGRILVPPQVGRIAVGLAFDKRSSHIFVAGGPGGAGYVYDAASGASLASYQFVASGPTFVNDVDVARDAAYFTDSQRPVIYRVPLGPGGELGSSFEIISLPTGFNLNGIVATSNGKSLIGVQSGMGVLLHVDVETGSSSVIDLGGYGVAQGDGLLLEGRKIYVMRNFAEILAEIRLSPDLSSGALQREITDPNFDVPTTIDRFGNTIYAVNARFSSGNDPNLTYTIVGVDLSGKN